MHFPNLQNRQGGDRIKPGRASGSEKTVSGFNQCCQFFFQCRRNLLRVRWQFSVSGKKAVFGRAILTVR